MQLPSHCCFAGLCLQTIADTEGHRKTKLPANEELSLVAWALRLCVRAETRVCRNTMLRDRQLPVFGDQGKVSPN